MIRGLSWSKDSRQIIGTTLQGQIIVWQILENRLTLSQRYSLSSNTSESDNTGGIIFTSSTNTPYAPHYVDPDLQFYVRPAGIDVANFGKCQGLEIEKMTIPQRF